MTDQLTLPELKQLKLQKVMQRNQYRIERNHKQHDGVEIELMYINQQIEKLTKNETTKNERTAFNRVQKDKR